MRITTASTALSDDVAARTRRYLVQMGVRVVCFLGAVLVDHWTRWVLLAGAVVLPYLAVVLANAGRERRTDPGTFLGATPAALPPGIHQDPHPGTTRGSEPGRGPGTAPHAAD